MTTAAAPARAAGTAQLVVFRLHGQEYALPVEHVSEVLRMVAFAPVPDAPAWVPGVINLRGQVVTVVDLRARLGLPAGEYDLATPIIVADTPTGHVGLIADEVVELLTLPSGAIDSAEDMDAGNAVSAVARAGDRLILIFDLAHVRARSETLS